MKKIRICYLIDTLWSIHAGTEKQLIELINRLDHNLVDVHLCCLSTERVYANEPFPDSKSLKSILNNCPVKILNYTGLLSPGLPNVIKKLIDYLNEHQIDIIHTFFLDAIYIGTIAAKLSGVKVIITSRRSMAYYYTLRDFLLLPIFNRIATSVCVNSQAVKNMVVQREKCPVAKIQVINNGIQLNQFTRNSSSKERTLQNLHINKDEFVVGMICNLRPVKQIEILLRALSVLKDDAIKFKSVIVGGEIYPYGEQIRQYSHELGLDENVIYTGKTDNILPYLHIFDVGVLTSSSEGFSNSILEYMAAGLPVIATSTGGNIEMLDGTNNILIPVNNHKALANAIKQIKSDNELSFKMSSSSLTEVRRSYQWSTIINHWHSYYNSLIQKVQCSNHIRLA